MYAINNNDNNSNKLNPSLELAPPFSQPVDGQSPISDINYKY